MFTLVYHAIANKEDSMLPSGIVVSPTALEGQLDYLLHYHQPAAVEDVLDVKTEADLPENSFCITFDDGFKGQKQHALDILEERGLRGFFFVPTCILENRVLPTVERQRLLQYSNGDYRDFYDAFVRGVQEFYPEVPEGDYLPTPANLESALSYYAEYAFYSPLERLYRKVRETMLPNTVFETIIDRMFGAAFNEAQIMETYFLTWDDVRAIKERGHEVGGHGHMHLLESNINAKQAVADHHLSLSLLEAHLGRPVRSYAYPYGIYTPETLAFLKERGILASFTCRAGRGIEGSMLLADRYDCKAFPFDALAEANALSCEEMATAMLLQAAS
jgi:peptidoglycan/xylan/chitin deacetylase (PgdA/CDA1 family)